MGMPSLHGSITAAILVSVLAFALPSFTALGEEISGLEPRFGDGKLVVVGNGFRPNEQVVLDVKLDAERRQFTTSADAQGHFELATGMNVRPGSGVELNARGNLGTGKAAITSAPLLPGTVAAPAEPSDPGQLPQAGGLGPAALFAALVALGLVGAGVALERSRGHA
jgi:hypothetical protein